MPVIQALSPSLHIPISVDTYRAGVARRAIDAGAQVVNDISGFRFDSLLPGLVKSSRTGVVLMHSRGMRPEIHRQSTTSDPVQTVLDGLKNSLATAQNAGIPREAVVVDPGIGFSKDTEASLKVLKNLEVFSTLRFPLLVGTSRKSFIRAVIGDGPEARLMGTAASIAAAIIGGAHIVRVHDVRQIRAVADVIDRTLIA